MITFVSRLAAVGLLATLIALFVQGIALPLSDRFARLEAEIETLEDQLSRFQNRLNRSRLRSSVEVGETALLDGPSETAAATEIQSIVAAAIPRSGATQLSFRIEDPIPAESLIEIPVTIEVEAEMAALQRLLHRFETSAPYLIVTRLSLSKPRGRAGDEATEPLVVSADINLIGLLAAGDKRQE